MNLFLLISVVIVVKVLGEFARCYYNSSLINGNGKACERKIPFYVYKLCSHEPKTCMDKVKFLFYQS